MFIVVDSYAYFSGAGGMTRVLPDLKGLHANSDAFLP